MQKILQMLKENLSIVVLGAAIFVYVVVTLPALFSTHHVLMNLEPYPDGLLYALSARNLVLNGGLQLFYDGSVLPLWVPPLYAAVLIPVYLVSVAPQFFYLTNVLLGLVSIFLLWQLIRKTTKSTLVIAFALFFYLTHAYILWLPTVPMSENLILPLFLLALTALTSKKLSRTELTISAVGIGGLLFTRYSIIGVVAVLGLWWLQIVFTTQTKRVKILFVAILALVAFAFLLYLASIRTNPVLLLSRIGTELSKENGFYNTKYFSPNFSSYIQIIVGQQTQLLWLHNSFTSVVVGVAGMLALLWGTVTCKERSRAIWLLATFLAQFPLLLLFYTVDARYIFLSIPLFILAVIWWMDSNLELIWKYKKVAIVIGIIIVSTHLFSQLQLFTQLITNNLLHRSTAWQFESIQHFNRFATQRNFSSESSNELLLITALPPFLVDAYQTTPYHVLPLSQSQEFLQKGEHVWGKDVPYENLMIGYDSWLREGKKLYISNSYITHQQTVIADFEEFKRKYNLKLVSSGCLDACNIYEIELKEE